MRDKPLMPTIEKRREVKDPRKLLKIHQVKAHKRKDYGRCNRAESMNKKLAQLLLWWKVEEIQDAIDRLDTLSPLALYKTSRYGRI